ncbi:MAG: ester cyclase, partial [Acidobacteriota bacterium]
VVDELVAPDSISHHLSWGMAANRMGLKQLIAMFRTAFPDLVCTLEDEIVHGDTAAARWAMRGTHQGPFLGNPPTRKSIVVPGILYARMRDSQVVEIWTLVDQMGVLQQLGLIPPPR